MHHGHAPDGRLMRSSDVKCGVATPLSQSRESHLPDFSPTLFSPHPPGLGSLTPPSDSSASPGSTSVAPLPSESDQTLKIHRREEV
jgi:hypothetical protein